MVTVQDCTKSHLVTTAMHGIVPSSARYSGSLLKPALSVTEKTSSATAKECFAADSSDDSLVAAADPT